jgi:uncharacterized LabA/DUF88 family protein
MFTQKTTKIAHIATKEPHVIEELDALLQKRVRMYIDYANVRPWAQKTKWNIDLKRAKQFFDSFSQVEELLHYQGYIDGDTDSQKEIRAIRNMGYTLHTKPVKEMRHSIDATSIPKDSTALISQFIRACLVRKLEIQTVEYLNQRFVDMNKKGECIIHDRKCNFDVEIATQMLLDLERDRTDTFVLWSGDSDFADPIETILAHSNKNVVLFCTARRVSKDLSILKEKGLCIFDIQKIRNFIYWNKQIQSTPYKKAPKSKGDIQKDAPKL